MHTPSHLIMTAALQKAARGRLPIITSAFLLGSVAPDIPLFLLSIGAGYYFQHILGWSRHVAFRHIFSDLYFHDPWWIALHNMLHSPTLLALILSSLWVLDYRQAAWSRWCFWFFLACLLHGVVDVFTHHDDGPLLFFPFEWTIRFHSPVSYWDSRHYAMKFAPIELGLDLALLLYLFGPLIWRHISGRITSPPPSGSGARRSGDLQ